MDVRPGGGAPGVLKGVEGGFLLASRCAADWTGAALLSPKVVCLLRLLEKRRVQGGSRAANGGWSAIVFVETKVCTQ